VGVHVVPDHHDECQLFWGVYTPMKDVDTSIKFSAPLSFEIEKFDLLLDHDTSICAKDNTNVSFGIYNRKNITISIVGYSRILTKKFLDKMLNIR
jgi:hypothetical protein